MIGEKYETKSTKLPYKFDITSEHQTYSFSSGEIGLPKYVVLKLSGDGKLPNWFLNRIELVNETLDERYEFPFNKWVDKRQSVLIKVKKTNKVSVTHETDFKSRLELLNF